MSDFENKDQFMYTRVTSTMVINGSIESEDNLLIEGKVYGDVTTSADASVSNLIIGNVKAENLVLDNARIKGNIETGSALNIEDRTIVVGDVKSESIKVGGKIKGNLEIEDSATLTETALVAGDVTAGYVITEAGARIQGNITTKRKDIHTDLDAEFDLGGDL